MEGSAIEAEGLVKAYGKEVRALDVLSQQDGPMTAGELADGMHLTSGAITSVIDRLERAGWAKRVRDPGDRRRVLVEVTAKVQAMGDAIYGTLDDVLAEFPDYTDEQLRLLIEFTRQGRAWTEARIATARAQTRNARGHKRLRGRGTA